jgi:hypothetical protein
LLWSRTTKRLLSRPRAEWMVLRVDQRLQPDRLAQSMALESRLWPLLVERLLRHPHREQRLRRPPMERVLGWLRVKQVQRWLRVKQMHPWLPAKRVQRWLRVKQVQRWLRVKRVHPWLRVKRVQRWLRVGLVLRRRRRCWPREVGWPRLCGWGLRCRGLRLGLLGWCRRFLRCWPGIGRFRSWFGSRMRRCSGS